MNRNTLPSRQRHRIESLERAGYRVVRQMDARDAEWNGQSPDVIMIEETTAPHRVTVEVNAFGDVR